MCIEHHYQPFSGTGDRKEEPDIEGKIAASPQQPLQKFEDMVQNGAFEQLEEYLLVVKKSLEEALVLEQAARNLLAVLTPEGEVETLAAKKLADALGGDV